MHACMHAMYQYNYTNYILRMLIVYTHYIILKYYYHAVYKLL